MIVREKNALFFYAVPPDGSHLSDLWDGKPSGGL